MTHHVTDHLTFGLRKTKVKVHVVQKSRKSRKNVPWDKSSHWAVFEWVVLIPNFIEEINDHG
jgi:hypothetical protein